MSYQKLKLIVKDTDLYFFGLNSQSSNSIYPYGHNEEKPNNRSLKFKQTHSLEVKREGAKGTIPSLVYISYSVENDAIRKVMVNYIKKNIIMGKELGIKVKYMEIELDTVTMGASENIGTYPKFIDYKVTNLEFADDYLDNPIYAAGKYSQHNLSEEDLRLADSVTDEDISEFIYTDSDRRFSRSSEAPQSVGESTSDESFSGVGV